MIDFKDICAKDISLRNYQQEAKEKIFSLWNHVNNVLYQMPTGTGKTRLFTSIIRDINIWGLRNQHSLQILIIAHRSELIEQIDKSLEKYHIKHGIIAGTLKHKRDLTSTIQVASIQTITSYYYKQTVQDLNIDFIIIDEAHHAMAKSYTKLWELYPNSKKLGVTATPWRMNNEGFKKNFESFLPSMSIKEFMKCGWLAPYKYFSIPQNSKIQRTLDSINEFDIEGDYKQCALEQAMDKEHIRAQLFDSYKKFAYGKKGIIYSISRTHSKHICEKYRNEGVRIVYIDSNTPTKEREELVYKFRNGELDIIVNVDIFSEGFDCPDIEFIQLARPTRSLVKYIQQVGRGLRKNGNKECIILDNVGMYTLFGLPDEDRDWEVYFNGNNKNKPQTASNKTLKNYTKEYYDINMHEGNEEMALIQDTYLPEKVIPITQIQHNQPYIEDLKENSPKIFFIESKPFWKGKYKIEETNEGYFLVNIRNEKRTFLCKGILSSVGKIIIEKKIKENYYTIIKCNDIGSINKNTYIIGYLMEFGKIIKFSAFDNSVKMKIVNI